MTSGHRDQLQRSNLSRRELVRRTGVLSSAALLAPHLAAGGKAAAASIKRPTFKQSSPATLTFLSEEVGVETIKVTDRIIAEFEASHPDVAVEAEYLEAAVERLQSLIAVGEPPDIGKFNSTEIARFALEGLIEPVTDIVERMGGVPEKVRLTVDGQDYFVPNEVNYWMLFYRKDLFEKAGLEPPRGWDDYLAVSEKLTDPGNNQFGNLLVTNPASTYTSTEVLNHFWSNGVNLFVWDGGEWQVALDEEPNLTAAAGALEWMARRAQYSPVTTNYDWPDVNQAYGSGQIAMVEFIGARTLDYLRSQVPELEPLTGVVPLPYPPDKQPRRQSSVGGYCIFKKEGRDQELAKELVLSMVTGDAYLEWLWSVPGHQIPPRQDLYEGRWREHPYLQQRGDLMQVIEDARNTSYIPVRGPEGEQLNIAGAALRPTVIYGTMITDVVLENKDPSESVKRAAEDMREFIKSIEPFLD